MHFLPVKNKGGVVWTAQELCWSGSRAPAPFQRMENGQLEDFQAVHPTGSVCIGGLCSTVGGGVSSECILNWRHLETGVEVESYFPNACRLPFGSPWLELPFPCRGQKSPPPNCGGPFHATGQLATRRNQSPNGMSRATCPMRLCHPEVTLSRHWCCVTMF